MKRILEWSIRIFWFFLGFEALVVALGIVHYRMFEPHPPINLFGGLMLGSIMLLIAATLLTAYFALCRFTPGLVRPTTFVVSITLWTVAHGAVERYVTPLIDGRTGSSPSLALLGILAFVLTIVGAVGYYRATIPVLYNILLPGLSRSARLF